MREQILAALSQYGSPALFALVVIAAIGVPLPLTLLLIVTGSLVSQRVMNFWSAVALASAGSVIGDQIGYLIGRRGGSALVEKFSRFLGGPTNIRKAEAKAQQWGGPGILLSRWPLSPLSPLVNLVSGTTGYPWSRFLLWDTLGETARVMICVLSGFWFSDRVQELDAFLGDITWTILALTAAVILGGNLVSRRLQKKLAPQSRR